VYASLLLLPGHALKSRAALATALQVIAATIESICFDVEMART
jgi:hypothetical protein